MLSANIPVPEGVHTVETRPERGDRLPQSVEDVRQSFIITVQAMAVVTALFAGIQAQLLSGTLSAPSPAASEAVIHALLLVSYGAALSAMIFLDIHRPIAMGTQGRELELHLSHGSLRSLLFVWHHCVTSTIFGTFSILLQISLLAWINMSSQDLGAALPGYLVHKFCVGFVTGLKRELES
ncbi:hypothetical protein B0H13DRAFT_1992913 [Mycena leptocephala]|nr:hypothetical protein B0H13DRAFT_1992913 [Mycena leptocephala]